ncbi:MAG: hypothetical protein AB7P03_23180 [Kofleriaceae bacterium]
MTRLSSVAIAVVIAASGTAAAQNDDRVTDEAIDRIDIDPDAYVQGAGALFDRLEAASPALRDVAKGAIRRARRKVSIGPSVGGFAGYGKDFDGAVSFGLGVEVFDIPVLPTFENLKAIVKERAKAKLKQALVESLKGQPPDPSQLEARIEQLAAEAWNQAVQEVLGMANIRAKTMERPSMTIALEGNRYFDSSDWAMRARVGKGVWKLTLGASLALGFTDPKVNAYLGPEIAVHFLTSKGPRASVLDVFVRADFELRNRNEAYSADIYALGVRYLLDVL